MLAILLLCGAAGLVAQEPDSAASPQRLKQLSIEQLLNVEVTSVSRRPESLSQAPSAIQVITHDDIVRSGATSLPEALRLAANLEVAQIDARQWAISARGFNSTTANKLLVLIDGRSVYTPLYSGVFWDAQDVLLADVDRIEVISGPGATLWGANAVNGVINVITRNSADTQGPYSALGGGTEPQGFGAWRWGGTSGSRVHYRVYGKAFARDETRLANGNSGMDDWTFGQGGFRADWEKSDRTQVTLQGDIYSGDITQPTAAEIDLGGGNVTGAWSHAFSSSSSARLQAYFDRTHRVIPGTFAEDLDTYDVDYQHHLVVGRRHDVVAGAGFRFMSDQVGNTPVLAFLPAHVHRKWLTGFVQDEIALVANRLRLTLGAKVEHNDYTGLEVQPGARVSWTADRRGMLWAAASRAIRAPSRIDREFFVPAQPPYILAGGPGFRSEEELAYELGYRFQAGERLNLSVATFYNRYHDLRSVEELNPPAPFPAIIGNGQDGKSYGAEVMVDYRASERWRLRAGYTELRVTIRPQPGSTDTTHGSGEAADPERQLLLQPSFDLMPHLSLDAAGRYVGAIASQRVPAYAELDLRLAWAPLSALRLSVVGQSLLHARHPEFGAVATRHEITRGVYGQLEWHF